MADRAVATIRSSSIVEGWRQDPDMTAFRETYYGKGINDEQFSLLVLHAQHLGLDVVKAEMQAISVQGKMIPYVTIHGLRKLAELSGRYDGSVGPEFCGEDRTTWHMFWDDDQPPAAARFTVFKKGESFPTIAYVTYRECVKTFLPQGSRNKAPTKTWAEMPAYMLGIRAETTALKKARLVPIDVPTWDDEEESAPYEVKVGAMRRLHAVGREHGLGHDDVRTVVQALNPGTSSLTNAHIQAPELREASAYIDAGLDDPGRPVKEAVATTDVDGRTVDTATGEIIEAERPAVESQRQALRKLGLRLKLSSNELTAFCGDLEVLSYDRAAELIKHFLSHTAAEIRAGLAQPLLREPVGFPDGLAAGDVFPGFDPDDDGTADLFGDTEEAEIARRRAKAESLTS